MTPAERTADMPDSWLVLYNSSHPQSVAWAGWYQGERGIPAENMVALNASQAEHLDTLADVQAQIITPVRDLLANDPELEQRIMGIVLGFRLPGHYDSPPLNPGTGGFSVADALQDMFDDGLAPASQKQDNPDNPHFQGNILPPGGRLTKATMAANTYMVARIAAPSMAEAFDLTVKAKAVENAGCVLCGESVVYDYFDPAFPSTEWFWLKAAVESAELSAVPWEEFDLNAGPPQPVGGEAFRFSIYKLLGWSSADFVNPNPGSRVLAFQFISFGAVTVRSTTAEGGNFVPNALAAGYAAAIGATGEPQCCVGPFPDTLLAALQQGWTLGEAYYLANPFNDWMWNLVGDPFLTIPDWLQDPNPLPGQAATPNPAEAAMNTPYNAVLSWTTGTDTDSHDVYFGSNPTPGAGEFQGNQTSTTFDPGPLLFDTVYYWRVDEVNVQGATTGAVWSFTTEPAPPSPGDGDVNMDGNVDGLDIPPFVGVLLGNIQDPFQVAAADLDGSGSVDDDDAYLFLGPLVYGEPAPDELKGTGDANGDGHVNGEDIEAFLDMLFNGVGTQSLRARWGADMNRDDAITFDDVSLFVTALLMS